MKVAEMSIEELKNLISTVVEQKLTELFGDPDWGMELREEVKERLRATSKAEAEGKRGIPASEVAKRIGIDW